MRGGSNARLPQDTSALCLLGESLPGLCDGYLDMSQGAQDTASIFMAAATGCMENFATPGPPSRVHVLVLRPKHFGSVGPFARMSLPGAEEERSSFF